MDIVSEHPPTDSKDWSDIKNSSIELLKKTYEHKKEKGAPGPKGGYKGGPGRVRGNMGAIGGLGGASEPFSQSTRGEITYDRHVHVHASEIVKLGTIAEVDAFSSAKLLVYRPYF